MAYATVEDLVARFSERELIQLTDRSTPPADTVDDAIAQQALDSASSIMDGFIGAKYRLPLSTPSPILTEICGDMARYRLFADQAPDLVAKRNDAAMTMLRDIAKGLVKIDAAGLEPPPRADVIEVSGPERTSTRDSLRRF